MIQQNDLTTTEPKHSDYLWEYRKHECLNAEIPSTSYKHLKPSENWKNKNGKQSACYSIQDNVESHLSAEIQPEIDLFICEWLPAYRNNSWQKRPSSLIENKTQRGLLTWKQKSTLQNGYTVFGSPNSFPSLDLLVWNLPVSSYTQLCKC